MDGEIFLGIIINCGEDHVSLYVFQTGAGVLEKPKDMMKQCFRDITAGQTEGLLPFVPISITGCNMVTVVRLCGVEWHVITVKRDVERLKSKQRFGLNDSEKLNEPTFSEFWSARARACFFRSATLF